MLGRHAGRRRASLNTQVLAACTTCVVVVDAAPAEGDLGERVVELAYAPAVCGRHQVVLRANLCVIM